MRYVLNRMRNLFSHFYFSGYHENSSKIDSFLYKNYHNSKNEYLNIIFLSIQHIPHLSCKFDHFNKKIFDFDTSF